MSTSDTYELETRYGPIAVRPTQADHIFVQGGGRIGEFIVNGVPVIFTFHLGDYGDGFEPYRDPKTGRADYAFSGRRADSLVDASRSAEKKITREVVDVVSDWADDNPEALGLAQSEAVQMELESLRGKLAELEDQAEEVRARIRELESR